MANAILEGRSADAIKALNVIKFNRIDPVIVLSEVSTAICDLLLIKELLKDNLPQPEIAKALKAREYKVKLYCAASVNKTEEKLRQALLLCSEADRNIKLGAQGYEVIERLICSL